MEWFTDLIESRALKGYNSKIIENIHARENYYNHFSVKNFLRRYMEIMGQSGRSKHCWNSTTMDITCNGLQWLSDIGCFPHCIQWLLNWNKHISRVFCAMLRKTLCNRETKREGVIVKYLELWHSHWYGDRLSSMQVMQSSEME